MNNLAELTPDAPLSSSSSQSSEAEFDFGATTGGRRVGVGSETQASASSCCFCDCGVTILLTGDCGFEIIGGVAYSVGKQWVYATVGSDPCGLVAALAINEVGNPYHARDTEQIHVLYTTMARSRQCCGYPPACYKAMGLRLQRVGQSLRPVLFTPRLRPVVRRPVV